MPRLLALDVDGTLLRSDNTLSERNRRALERARSAGWQIALATGKPPWAIVRLAEALGLDGPHVVANGCGLWPTGGELELLARIPDQGVAVSLAWAASLGIPRALSGPRGVFCQPSWGVQEVTSALREVGEQPPDVVDDAVLTEPEPWKVILILRAQAGAPATEAPQVQGGQWVRTHPNFFETVPCEASKGRALRLLCARRGIAQSDVVAVGDSDNDTELLSWAGLGVAMAHAPAHVRAAARQVTASNDEDGVALVVEELLGRPSAG